MPTCACGFLLLWGSVAIAAGQEPSYNGRLLSQWLAEEYASSPSVVAGLRPPEQAIRAMGTNAIPALLEWISYERSPSEQSSQSVAAVTHWRERTLSPEERAESTKYAFKFLGPLGRPAIPELTRLARTSSDPKRAERCADSLSFIGPEAIPNLLSLATNGPPPTRWYAIAALEFFARDPAAAPAVPVLLECLSDTNESIADEAGTILPQISLPALVLPALTNALRSPDAHMRKQAAWCLGGLLGDAISAIPPSVRRRATQTTRFALLPPTPCAQSVMRPSAMLRHDNSPPEQA